MLRRLNIWLEEEGEERKRRHVSTSVFISRRYKRYPQNCVVHYLLSGLSSYGIAQSPLRVIPMEPPCSDLNSSRYNLTALAWARIRLWPTLRDGSIEKEVSKKKGTRGPKKRRRKPTSMVQ